MISNLKFHFGCILQVLFWWEGLYLLWDSTDNLNSCRNISILWFLRKYFWFSYDVWYSVWDLINWLWLWIWHSILGDYYKSYFERVCIRFETRLIIRSHAENFNLWFLQEYFWFFIRCLVFDWETDYLTSNMKFYFEWLLQVLFWEGKRSFTRGKFFHWARTRDLIWYIRSIKINWWLSHIILLKLIFEKNCRIFLIYIKLISCNNVNKLKSFASKWRTTLFDIHLYRIIDDLFIEPNFKLHLFKILLLTLFIVFNKFVGLAQDF